MSRDAQQSEPKTNRPAADCLLSRDQLLIHMGQMNCVAAQLSPLAEFIGSDARLPAVAEPMEASESLRQAIRVLARPTEQLSVQTAVPGAHFASWFYSEGPLFARPTYGCWLEQGRARISGPWENTRLAGEIGGHLDPSLAASPSGTLVRLSSDGLAMLMVVQDVVRTNFLQQLLNRQTVSAVRIRRDDIRDHRSAKPDDDPRWLSPFLNWSWPDLLAGGDLGRGMAELVEAGLVSVSRVDWIATEALQQFVRSLLCSVPAVALTYQTIALQAAPRRLILVRGSTLWEVGSDPSRSTDVFVRDVAPQTAFDDVLTFLGGVPESVPPSRASVRPSRKPVRVESARQSISDRTAPPQRMGAGLKRSMEGGVNGTHAAHEIDSPPDYFSHWLTALLVAAGTWSAVALLVFLGGAAGHFFLVVAGYNLAIVGLAGGAVRLSRRSLARIAAGLACVPMVGPWLLLGPIVGLGLLITGARQNKPAAVGSA